LRSAGNRFNFENWNEEDIPVPGTITGGFHLSGGYQ
jgi:hypothetical protein